MLPLVQNVIASLADFETAREAGLITLRPHHDDEDLLIANYTPQQQYTNVWDDVTLASRGLIFRWSSGEIVAYPFGKFFNYGDPHNDSIDLTQKVEVTDKADGSCGILYHAPDGRYAVATRGSMHSEQAEHATELYRHQYESVWSPDEDYTFIFEIIYPEGKIVLDYDGMDDLILLGAVEKATGRSVNRQQLEAFGYPGPIVEVFDYKSLHEAVDAEQTKNREGFVVRFVDSDKRIKVKFEEYLMLHRIVFDLTPRRVWEALSSGQDISPWLISLPDEFTQDIEKWRDELLLAHDLVRQAAEMIYANVREHVPVGSSQAEFAAYISRHMEAPFSGLVFSLNSGKDITESIWKMIRP